MSAAGSANVIVLKELMLCDRRSPKLFDIPAII